MQVFGWRLKAVLTLSTRAIIDLISRFETRGWQGDITYSLSAKIQNSDFGKVVQGKNNLTMATKDYLPYYAFGNVVSGFGRGSKSLGCPTANMEKDAVEALPLDMETGIYYGWAALDEKVYKMVMSIGWNPFYRNDRKSMEIHLLHKFEEDFYGKELKIIVLGYIRPETNFSSVDELKKAIKNDIAIAKKSLDESNNAKYKEDPFLNS